MYYYLNDDHSISPSTLEEWSNQLEHMTFNESKNVAEDTIGNKLISTVWLGLDHNHFSVIFIPTGPPLLFETMIFDTNASNDYSLGEDIYQDRYSTWDQAIIGHKKAIEWVKNRFKND
jgi:hypothetical protein